MNNSIDEVNASSGRAEQENRDDAEITELLGDLDSSLYRMGRLMTSGQMKFRDRTGLPAPQYMVLKILEHDGPTRVSDIAEGMGVKNPAVSMVLQELEDEGNVERSHDAVDQRVVTVSITTKGRERLAHVAAERLKLNRLFTADLSREDLSTFIRIINTLADTVSKSLR